MSRSPWKYFYLGILVLFSFSTFAQKTPILVESSSYFGTPLRHSPKIVYNTDIFSWGHDLDVKWQMIGKKKWQEKHHYPRLGIQLNYLNIGQPDTLGFAIGILPNISFALVKKERWDFRFQFSYGMAYVNKKFDELFNPLNTAISSTINSNVIVKLENQFQLHPRFWLKSGVNLIHLSNGTNKIPNLGVNVAAFNIGISYRPSPLADSEFITNGIQKFHYNKWGGDLQLGLGFRERQQARGPVYPIYSTSAAIVFRPNSTNHMRVGFEYEYNRGTFVLGKEIWLFDNDDDARAGATRLNVFYAHEFRFGPLGLYLLMGTNVSGKSVMLNSNIYNKYSVRYYLPTIGNPKTSFYGSINLKSNNTIAEYYSFSAGAIF